jgi:hypothetical protein
MVKQTAMNPTGCRHLGQPRGKTVAPQSGLNQLNFLTTDHTDSIRMLELNRSDQSPPESFIRIESV